MPSKAPYSVTFKPIIPRLDRPLLDMNTLMPELEAASLEWANEFINVIKVYPPPKKNGVYQRTGRLAANWKPQLRREPARLTTFIVNAVRDPKTGAYYMQRVQGITQIAMHKRTGWMNVWGAMRKFGSRDFKLRVQRTIDRHIARQKAFHPVVKP